MSKPKVSPELALQIKEVQVGKIRVLVEIKPPVLRIRLAETVKTYAKTLEVDFNAYVTYRSKVTPYIAIEVDINKIPAIAKLPWVKKLWHVPTMELMWDPVLPYATAVEEVTLMDTARHIGVDIAKELGYTGKGIIIGLVDSGVEKTHPMLEGKVLAEKNFYPDAPDTGDRLGHGTFCGSILVGNYWESPIGPLEGMAPDAMLVNAKAFEETGSGADILMAAMEWACEQGAQICSNSWGGPFYEPIRDLAIRLKETYGTIFVFSAGNNGPDPETIRYPAGFVEVIAVGAVSVRSPEPDAVAGFSSRGPNWQGNIKPDIMAPGGNRVGDIIYESIYAAGLGGTVRAARGTSASAPHIAGGLALILESGRTVDYLFRAARDIMAPAKDNDSGWGTADIGKSVELPPPQPYFLSVDSTPVTNLRFTVDSLEGVTPWKQQLMEDRYKVSVPEVAKVNGDYYGFRHWEDSSTCAFRVIHLIGDLNLVATYELVPVAHTLTVTSEAVSGIIFTIDGAEHKTPYSGLLEEKTHQISMPSLTRVGGRVYIFENWEDGSTSPTRSIDLTTDVMVSATYKPAFGLFKKCGDMHDIKDEIDGCMFTCPDDGVADSIVVYLKGTGGGRVKCALYSGLHEWNLLGVTEERTIGIVDAWERFRFLEPKPVLVANTEYTLVVWASVPVSILMEFTGFLQRIDKDLTYNEFPHPLSPDGIGWYHLSIYCIYSAELPPTHTLAVQSSPISGVPVTVDDAPIGATPVSSTLYEGEHMIKVPEELEV